MKKYIAVFVIGVILGGITNKIRHSLIQTFTQEPLKQSPVKQLNEKFDVSRVS